MQWVWKYFLHKGKAKIRLYQWSGRYRWQMKTCNREIALTCSYGQKTRRIMVSDARPGMTDEDVKTELHRGHAQGLGCPWISYKLILHTWPPLTPEFPTSWLWARPQPATPELPTSGYKYAKVGNCQLLLSMTALAATHQLCSTIDDRVTS